MSTKWYLCGPMSFVPQFNIPQFDRIAARLRSREWAVVSPAELNSPEVRKDYLKSKTGKPNNKHGTWGDFLSRDAKLVSDQIDGIIVLPNWEKSRGARLEVFVGLLTGKEFMEWNDNICIPYPRTAQYMRNELKEHMP